MTAENRYISVCSMLQEYDLHTGSRGADGVIADPHKWVNSVYFPFYAQAAELLIEARAQMDTAATPRTVITALGRIVKNVADHRESFKGIFQRGDRFLVCDGYRMVRFSEDVSSLPHVENDFNADAVFNSAEKNDTPLELPTVAELKAYIAGVKAKIGKSDAAWCRSKLSAYCLGGYIYVNAKYLLDMLQALPGCKAYGPGGPNAPIYFKAEDGNDGILLPVRPPEPETEEKAKAKDAA